MAPTHRPMPRRLRRRLVLWAAGADFVKTGGAAYLGGVAIEGGFLLPTRTLWIVVIISGLVAAADRIHEGIGQALRDYAEGANGEPPA